MSTQSLLQESSLTILSHKTLDLLSLKLNKKRLLTAEDGTLRDYRGLIELSGVSKERVENNPDHTKMLISLWCQKEGVKVSDLTSALASLGRFDVLSDVQSLIVADCEIAHRKGITSVSLTDTKNALTISDLVANQTKQQMLDYHAIVLHSNDFEDEEFAAHIVERLEGAGLRIFLPARDLIAGTIEHSASAEIIENRCKRVILVVTDSFCKDTAKYKFSMDLVTFVSMKKEKGFVIPVIYKECEKLPPNISMLFRLDYRRKKLVNFYKKLFECFEVKNVSKELLTYPDEQNGSSPASLPSWSTQSSVSSFLKNGDSVATAVTDLTISSRVSARNYSVRPDNTTLTVGSNGTVSTVRSNGTVSTVRSNDSNSLLLPDVPNEEPGGGLIQKLKAVKKKVFPRKERAEAYVAQ